MKRQRRRLLLFSLSLTKEKPPPPLEGFLTNAWTSSGKQNPPKPIPGFRNAGPIRGSIAIPRATLVTSAPTASQRSATMLMNEIFIARKELDACLINSEELVSVTIQAGF